MTLKPLRFMAHKIKAYCIDCIDNPRKHPMGYPMLIYPAVLYVGILLALRPEFDTLPQDSWYQRIKKEYREFH